MDRAAIDPAFKFILSEIAIRLADAARIGRAADICAASGSVTEGITFPWRSTRCSTRLAAYMTPPR